MSKNIFISTPIAGFEDEEKYFLYRKKMESICVDLQKEFGEENIYGAFLNVSDFNSYDSPEKAALVDMQHLERVDYFILIYPTKVATSALTELGVALGLNKKILIITPNIQILPYMVQGLSALETKSVEFLIKDIIKEKIVEDIVKFLKM